MKNRRRSQLVLRRAALLLLPGLAACASGAGGGNSEAAMEEPVPEPAVAEALATITAADVGRAVGVLAHDSMRGRDTPSPELEEAAAYLADRFRAMGLEPAGDDGTFIDRWAWERSRLSMDETVVRFQDGDAPGLEYGVDFFMVPGMEATTAEAAYVGVAGEDRPTAEQRGKIAVFDHPGQEADEQWGRTFGTTVQSTMMTGATGLIMILDPGFPGEAVGQLANMMAAQQAPMPIVGLTSTAAERLLASAGRDLADVRAQDGPVVLGDSPIELAWSRTTDAITPPNVVAMLPGSDPALAGTYVVLTAHFDHVGIGTPDETGDSIYNGADDDASGTAAILEIAEAFASLPEAPARSVLFLAVSGEEYGLLGSTAYVEDPPVIDIDSVVANVNMDMVGRNAPDTVIGIGQEYTTLEDVLDAIQERHPELGLNVILDPAPEKNFFFRSDQLAFIQAGIPAVFFTTDEHEDYHRPSDEPAKINNDKVARVARLGFLLAYRVAEDPAAPEWTSEGRRQVDRMLGAESPF